MFIRGLSRKWRTGAVPVYLNVYDLTTINGYAYWLGLGIYHSGVQVHGVEYAFGAHDHSTSGIFEVEPRQCPGFQFRKSILIGRTDLGPREVRLLIDDMADDYTGNMYHLISRNCNHFCNDACVRITGNPIPRWVNRLANLGFLCNCVLPVGLHVAETSAKERVIVRAAATAKEKEEKVRLRIKSPRYTVSHPSSPSSAAISRNNSCVAAISSTTATSSASSSSNEEQKMSRKKRGRRRTSSSSCSNLVASTTPSSSATTHS